MDCSLPGSSIHGIFQARVLEWGAIAFSLLKAIFLQMDLLNWVSHENPIPFANNWVMAGYLTRCWLMNEMDVRSSGGVLEMVSCIEAKIAREEIVCLLFPGIVGPRFYLLSWYRYFAFSLRTKTWLEHGLLESGAGVSMSHLDHTCFWTSYVRKFNFFIIQCSLGQSILVTQSYLTLLRPHGL